MFIALFSGLEAPGWFSIRVATFLGKVVLVLFDDPGSGLRSRKIVAYHDRCEGTYEARSMHLHLQIRCADR